MAKRPTTAARAALALAEAARLPGSFDPDEVAREDVGNIFRLEHVNLRVPDAKLANIFYIMRGVIQEGLSRHQYRFTALIDPATNEKVFELEHEVRSFRHPMFLRPLINRDPDPIAGPYSGAERLVPNPRWGL